jgi:hypothetical protein
MRLLNIDTFRLESFQNADEAPPYAIFSHRWEEEEVIYDDLQEPLINQDFRVLQRRFEAMEKRFDGLMCRLEEQNPTKSTRPTFAQSEQSAPTLLRRNDSPVPLLQYQEHDAQDNWGRLGDLQPIANGSSNHLHESSTWDTEALRIDLEDAKSTSLLVASYPHLARAVMKKGWGKIVGCCREVRRLGMRYVWIDTCCIDQKSSSEVYESINSMFDWYRIAKLCLAYLSDVTDGLNTGDNDDIDTYIDRAVDSARTLRLTSSASQRRSLRGSGVNFNRSQWFHRGWTLQELIAPAEVWFYQYDWQLLGLRSSLAYRISCITDIDELILQKNGLLCLHSFSVATKMSWAAGRRTSRPEDRAYSLMGLFGINMPTLYGEGEEAAFFRLQTKIFQVFSDHSIFAWEPRYAACSDA